MPPSFIMAGNQHRTGLGNPDSPRWRVSKLNPLLVTAERQELDPSLFERAAHAQNSAGARIDDTLFQADHGIERNDRPIRQSLTGPSEERARRPNLAGGDHPRGKAVASSGYHLMRFFYSLVLPPASLAREG